MSSKKRGVLKPIGRHLDVLRTVLATPWEAWGTIYGRIPFGYDEEVQDCVNAGFLDVTFWGLAPHYSITDKGKAFLAEREAAQNHE